MERYLTLNEIAVHSYESALNIQKELIDNGYVVMLSREESLWIINWIFDPTQTSNRNAVIFYSREDYEWEEYKKQKANE